MRLTKTEAMKTTALRARKCFPNHFMILPAEISTLRPFSPWLNRAIQDPQCLHPSDNVLFIQRQTKSPPRQFVRGTVFTCFFSNKGRELPSNGPLSVLQSLE